MLQRETDSAGARPTRRPVGPKERPAGRARLVSDRAGCGPVVAGLRCAWAIGASRRQGGLAMHRLRCVVVIGALTVAVCVVAAGPAAAAKGGNNDIAKLCQKGTWKTLVTNTGDPFATQGDCVNDGAQGSAPFGTAGKTLCAALGGRFELRTASWSCVYASPPNPQQPPDLAIACAADAPQGTFQTEQIQSEDLWVGICLQFATVPGVRTG